MFNFLYLYVFTLQTIADAFYCRILIYLAQAIQHTDRSLYRNKNLRVQHGTQGTNFENMTLTTTATRGESESYLVLLSLYSCLGIYLRYLLTEFELDLCQTLNTYTNIYIKQKCIIL